jgi:LacI family transcriptional regulator
MATIKDVARLAGVGLGTASRVISGNGSFSADAARRVQAAATELGFRPSNIARALSSRSTGTVGVFVPDFNGPFFGPLLNTIDNELRLHDRHMVAANGCGHEDARQQALDGAQFLIDRECDGIIIVSNALRDADFVSLCKQFPRIAMINRDVKGLRARCFSVDHRAAGRLAAHALLDHGHRQFAIVSGPPSAGDNRQRLQGFFDQLAERGVAADSVIVEEGDFSAQSGWDATQRLLKRKANITGLFCANDQMAMGALSCLNHDGISVPADISVVGYDDAEMAPFLSPRLTTVRIPIADMGLNACRLMLNECHGNELPVMHRFSAELIVRNSVSKVATLRLKQH